jgi:hypothetical protein
MVQSIGPIRGEKLTEVSASAEISRQNVKRENSLQKTRASSP